MIAPSDPSELAGFNQTSQVGERASKRRGVNEEEPIELIDEQEGEGQDDYGRLWDTPRKELLGKEIPESMCEFTSIKDLRREAKRKGNAGMSNSGPLLATEFRHGRDNEQTCVCRDCR